MFFFFPFSTNAPLYHLPIATIGLIIANVLVYVGMVTGAITDPQDWILAYGAGLHPAQWISSFFTHAGIGHLAGNMMFLWVFGLIVEGKIGWWRFLACYFGIGIVHSMLEQLVMLGYSGLAPGAVGASAAIFGIMAMAAFWAPLNEIRFFWFAMTFGIHSGTFEVGVYVMAAFYVGLEIIMVTFFGGGAASSLLHLTGALIGLPVGVALLKLNLVDCDGADLLHIWRSDYGKEKKKPEPKKETPEQTATRQVKQSDLLSQAKVQLREYLKSNNIPAALKLRDKMKNVAGGLALDRDELVAIIKHFHAAGQWQDSAPWMADLINRFPNGADPVRVKLAQMCVVEFNRPAKALELLEDIDMKRLPAQQAELAKKIAAKATQMQADGVFELDTDTW